MKFWMKSYALMLAALVVLPFFGCGSASNGAPPPPPITYTIGGTVSGLSGTALVLQNNGSNNLPIGANGSFTFTTSISRGSTYNVTVLTQPSGPAQSCMLTNGSGTANANVTSVQVACVGEWTWMNGANTGNQTGIYGTLGIAAPTNVPGSRYGPVIWTDAAGNPWLFGGFGLDSVESGNNYVSLNDLWMYSAGDWTWVGGSNVGNQFGTYGTQGVPAPSNIPGVRLGASATTDLAGSFWLFGGLGFSAVDARNLNDLWKYSAGEWTWMSGADFGGQFGTYGTQGVADPSNVPGARQNVPSWTDSSGNFWLFGGFGEDSAGHLGSLNDLWKYSAGEWTWVNGSNVINQSGMYGTQGTAAPTNVPGARASVVSWTDGSGNFWLFGGSGYDSNGAQGELNDLWKYSAGEWTWVSGSNMINQKGTDGTQGLAASNNVPGARQVAVGWIDVHGNLWLFGGYGYDSAGVLGELNDLWKYSAGEWTWMTGSNLIGQVGTYGTQGVTASSNVPGAREFGVSWTDASGNFWLFGGAIAPGGAPALNDLWRYEP